MDEGTAGPTGPHPKIALPEKKSWNIVNALPLFGHGTPLTIGNVALEANNGDFCDRKPAMHKWNKKVDMHWINRECFWVTGC